MELVLSFEKEKETNVNLATFASIIPLDSGILLDKEYAYQHYQHW